MAIKVTFWTDGYAPCMVQAGNLYGYDCNEAVATVARS